jgi:alcohol dehydrogenase
MSAGATALVLTEPHHFELRGFDMPEVPADAGLLRVEACGLCGTDHEQFSGVIRSRHAFIPGHEVVGVIEAVGNAAARRWGVRPGQRVAVEVFKSCGECAPCRRRRTPGVGAAIRCRPGGRRR